jgi:hypothetical protein
MGALIPPSAVSRRVAFKYVATGAEATAADGSSDFTLSFGTHGAMPSSAFNADVKCGGTAQPYSFDVVLSANTTTSIRVKCSAKLVAGDVLQVNCSTRT